MLEVRQLTFGYEAHQPVFSGFDLQVERHEALAVIGPSGCGKTTLLYLLAGLLNATGGSISINGQGLTRPRPQSGLVLQDHGLLPWATVTENARLGLKIRNFYGADGRHAPAGGDIDQASAKERVAYWLDRLNIDHLQDKYPAQLSRGQRQRTAIARTLVLEPDLLLLDEPFSALDAHTREDLRHIMQMLRDEFQLTRILVTHDIEEAILMGDRILTLTEGTNRQASVVGNSCRLEKVNRGDPEFRQQCDYLRSLLGRSM
jgi:NitT/TauT family transport system ATP-binding protein